MLSLERVELKGGEALQVIYRLAYELGVEIVVGALLVPTLRGTIEFSVYHRASVTGLRESILTDRIIKASGMDVAQQLEQADIDDPKNDDIYPEHSLSVVRSALRWLVGLPEEKLMVTASLAEVPASGAIQLQNVGCAIIPPPRYLFAPMIAEQTSETLAPFTRFALPSGQKTHAASRW